MIKTNFFHIKGQKWGFGITGGKDVALTFRQDVLRVVITNRHLITFEILKQNRKSCSCWGCWKMWSSKLGLPCESEWPWSFWYESQRLGENYSRLQRRLPWAWSWKVKTIFKKRLQHISKGIFLVMSPGLKFLTRVGSAFYGLGLNWENFP